MSEQARVQGQRHNMTARIWRICNDNGQGENWMASSREQGSGQLQKAELPPKEMVGLMFTGAVKLFELSTIWLTIQTEESIFESIDEMG